MLGLSIDGPGKRTAEPVPADMTRKPAFLNALQSAKAWKLALVSDLRQDVVGFH